MTMRRLACLWSCLAATACASPSAMTANVASPGATPAPAGAQPAPQVTAIPAAKGYHLSGDETLWPNGMSDDGDKTYMTWDITKPLPAVFAVNKGGKEEMVDSYMRNDILVIDRVYDNLVFRIDKAFAGARRVPPIRPAP